MAKIFETSEEFVELVTDKFGDTGLDTIGINLKVMSVTKAKDVIKVSKTSATTAFLTKKDLQVFVYEAALERLPRDVQEMLVEMALSNVWFDHEKDKLMVETNPFKQIFSMRQKHGERILDNLELSYAVIQEIEDEEKQKKEDEKERKKANKVAQQH